MHLQNFSKVSALHVVVCLDENLPQSTLPDRIVLGVELVKPVEGVAILEEQQILHDLQLHAFACMSRIDF